MKRLLIVMGTRPEAIKMAPVAQVCAKNPLLEVQVCVTGQHHTMLDQVLEFFDIPVDYNLRVMEQAQGLAEVTAKIVKDMPGIIATARPDIVLVHGDTNTTMSAALAAFYSRVPVAHVEAGLRTGYLLAPWPEEANRRLTAVLAQIHFAPTARARANLLRESVAAEHIRVTGNTVIDALFEARRILRASDCSDLERRFSFLPKGRHIVLVTGHRRENFGQGMLDICDALRRLAARGDLEVVYPVHLNPNVKAPVTERLGDMENIHLIEPLDYRTFVYLMDRSFLILTDSGGIQEQAPSLGKPVLVMRDVTERPEAVEAGTVRLVGTSPLRILEEASQLLDNPAAYARMSTAHNPYGDGLAAKRIAGILSGMPVAEYSGGDDRVQTPQPVL